ncbi:hypothetical protein LXG23DRAFT_39537 [Yarrowia lipolytica]|nr:hypothetical protein BKA90DRAFT_166799 [Yarrowia lipolytica]KAJ8051829.1 hypothetical protein LXG23DRAFT_39537 [Yarrowia lipolytica]
MILPFLSLASLALAQTQLNAPFTSLAVGFKGTGNLRQTYEDIIEINCGPLVRDGEELANYCVAPATGGEWNLGGSGSVQVVEQEEESPATSETSSAEESATTSAEESATTSAEVSATSDEESATTSAEVAATSDEESATTSAEVAATTSDISLLILRLLLQMKCLLPCGGAASATSSILESASNDGSVTTREASDSVTGLISSILGDAGSSTRVDGSAIDASVSASPASSVSSATASTPSSGSGTFPTSVFMTNVTEIVSTTYCKQGICGHTVVIWTTKVPVIHTVTTCPTVIEALSTNTDIPEPRPTNSVEILLTTQTLVESGATTTFTGTIVLTRTIDTSSTPQAKVPQIDSVPTTVAQANTGSKLMARLQLVLLPLLMM